MLSAAVQVETDHCGFTMPFYAACMPQRSTNSQECQKFNKVLFLQVASALWRSWPVDKVSMLTSGWNWAERIDSTSKTGETVVSTRHKL